MPPLTSVVKQSSKKTAPPAENGDVLSRISGIDFASDLGLKVLVYGESGTGKTTFWSTFPGPILAVLCSGGFRPGELRSIDTPENRKKVRTVTLREPEEFGLVVEAFPQLGYKTLVLDHVSGFCDIVMARLLGRELMPAQKFWGLASQQQYAQMAQQVKEYLRSALSLDANVVIVAQERIFNAREDGVDSDMIKPRVGPAVTPSLAGWLQPACDYVVQTFKRPLYTTREVEVIKGQPLTTIREREEGVEFCLRTEPHETFSTKFRVPKGRHLPAAIVDPTYEKLVAVIRGE